MLATVLLARSKTTHRAALYDKVLQHRETVLYVSGAPTRFGGAQTIIRGHSRWADAASLAVGAAQVIANIFPGQPPLLQSSKSEDATQNIAENNAPNATLQQQEAPALFSKNVDLKAERIRIQPMPSEPGRLKLVSERVINEKLIESKYRSPAPLETQAAAVPATRFSRLWQYSALGASVGAGVVGAALSSAFASNHAQSSSLLFSPKNVDRIVARLSRMRGAALKLGQMLSIQDSNMLPKELEQILLRVQNSANYMPDSQLEKIMVQQLGKNWRSKFISFDSTPFAAASIGQVHFATIVPPESDENLNTLSSAPLRVAVKIQYPGVAQSIDSDLSYLRTLSLLGNVLPRGMYLDNTLRVAKIELARECDYLAEASAMLRFKKLLSSSSCRSSVSLANSVNVPRVFEHISTSKVLVCEFVDGVSIGSVSHLDQTKRDEIGNRMLKLCLMQLFDFRFMQTDPNWSNFLFDEQTDVIHMLDFGAAREFPAKFTNTYLKLLKAAAIKDRAASIAFSQELGFLTGFESETMLNAHLNSLFLLASPFNPELTKPFDFGAQSITSSVRADIPVMLNERLTPPPDESYSLHRSLSGSFLLCAKLKARVDCAKLFNMY
ncbi:hypothetical protein HK100_003173 [Physocladia obscura]|uniref:ABC1 atypical kinase-like domain-containing protein n=1 Tax=Physocladia obscura TaxID=109957 RepID=A0AAD5SV89_9FUNG|nr:hypothetical protein HK100_003173 [Physocladia obscura]